MPRNLDWSKEKIAAPSRTPFEPLPAGRYTVTVYDVKEKQYSASSRNAGRTFYAIQFRVVDGERGANRRFYDNIGIFPTWAPNARHPEGADNFTFWRFFSVIEGKSEPELRKAAQDGSFEIPEPQELLGRKLDVLLGIEKDDYALNRAKEDGTFDENASYTRNNIKSFFPTKDSNSPAAAATEGDGGIIEF